MMRTCALSPALSPRISQMRGALGSGDRGAAPAGRALADRLVFGAELACHRVPSRSYAAVHGSLGILDQLSLGK